MILWQSPRRSTSSRTRCGSSWPMLPWPCSSTTLSSSSPARNHGGRPSLEMRPDSGDRILGSEARRRKRPCMSCTWRKWPSGLSPASSTASWKNVTRIIISWCAPLGQIQPSPSVHCARTLLIRPYVPRPWLPVFTPSGHDCARGNLLRIQLPSSGRPRPLPP